MAELMRHKFSALQIIERIIFECMSSERNSLSQLVDLRQRIHANPTIRGCMPIDANVLCTLLSFAREDNSAHYDRILGEMPLDLSAKGVAEYVALFACDRFVWQTYAGEKILYCFNGRYWESSLIAGDSSLRLFISTELFEVLSLLCAIPRKLECLKSTNKKVSFVRATVRTLANNAIRFDDNPYVIGFNDQVFDLIHAWFRPYNREDYISTTTGYDWREPTAREIARMRELLPVFARENVRNLFLDILSSGLCGRCVDELIIFSGSCTCCKGVVNELMYAMLGDNLCAITNNARPDPATSHKKRYIIFRDVCPRIDTGKFTKLTSVVECEERASLGIVDTLPTIDIKFSTTFVASVYRSSRFQHKYKFAFFTILAQSFMSLYARNFVFAAPEPIAWM